MRKNAGVVIAAVAALPLFLAACGGEDDSSGSAAPSKAAEQGTKPAAPGGEKVTQTNQPSGAPLKPAGKIDRAKVLEYSKCMRANGLKNFPDPDASGAIQMNGDLVDPASPEFQKAQQKCGSLMPGGGAPTSISTRGPESGS
ncbi:hypothetical protein Acsp04_52340 [Actinomadura sp. NBRC 104425]|uniref:hypothetical protein n=1 Tax=Actinomadura sp. NBRC 104425 TaxID=3032204 RepID=UPI0024A49864|nr:hypothetical protein [Actinomadura sp. NBRC 104425]GLZ14999.1 hypothetical protein Acsp04_52340 [Actinomadura sp. NBRC 104425]